jgi:hypothetical protein
MVVLRHLNRNRRRSFPAVYVAYLSEGLAAVTAWDGPADEGKPGREEEGNASSESW